MSEYLHPSSPHNLRRSGDMWGFSTAQNQAVRSFDDSSCLICPIGPQPTSTEQFDNHNLQHSLVPGAVRVMPRYSLPSDPYPPAAYSGLSPGGLFEFFVGPNQSAFLTRADVSACVCVCYYLSVSMSVSCKKMHLSSEFNAYSIPTKKMTNAT